MKSAVDGQEWREASLGEVIELKRGYDLPQRDRILGSVPIVSSSGITDHHTEAKVKAPGVVTGRYGTLGQIFFIREDFWPLNTTLYVRDFKGNDPRFISYFLRSLDFSAYSDKAAVPGLNRNHLHQETVRLPPLDEAARHCPRFGDAGRQDRAEPAHERNAGGDGAGPSSRIGSWTSARSAPSWRDASPTCRRRCGRSSPDRLVDSELGEIPEGWEVKPLGELCDAVRGLSYKGSGLSSSGVALHNLNSISKAGGYNNSGIKHYKGEYRARHIARPGDVIVANTDLTHNRWVIGHSAIVPARYGNESLFSHHLYRVRPRADSSLTSEYLCYLLNTRSMHGVVSGYATGTTVNMLPARRAPNTSDCLANNGDCTDL